MLMDIQRAKSRPTPGDVWTWLRGSAGSLRYRTLRSGLWLLAGDGLARAASVIKISVLGRLLPPADFGLVGIATSLLVGMDFFTQTGISQALIQKRSDILPYLNTAFTIQALRGALLCLAVWVAAPQVAAFYRADATTILRSIALVLLIRGFINPAVIYFRKDLDYRKDALWRSAGVVGSLTVGIAVAIVFRNVWALVASVISAQAIEAAASHFLVSFRPRFELDRSKARELFRFGKWVFWGNMFDAVNLYVDSLVIGRSLGLEPLGLYQVGSQLAMAPTALLGTHLSGLSLPALSKLRSEAEIGRAFLKVFRVLTVVILPFTCMLTLFAEPVVSIVLGRHWLGSVAIVRTLGWAGLGMAVSGLSGAALLASGKPSSSCRVSLVRTIVLLGLILPLMRHLGGLGVALAVALAAMAACVYSVAVLGRVSGWRAADIAGSLWRPALATLPFVAARLVGGATVSPYSLSVLGLTILFHLAVVVMAIRGELIDHPVGVAAPAIG